MLCCRTEFFVTVTEGLSAELLVKAERFGANDSSIVGWALLSNRSSPLAREPRISANG